MTISCKRLLRGIVLGGIAISAVLSLGQRVAYGGFLFDDGVWSCTYAYYGIGENVNYKKAYDCFKAHGILAFQIIMQFNGQGVPKNVAKANELLKESRKANPDDINFDPEVLSKAMKSLEREGQGQRRQLSFCKDAAMSTPSVDYCSDVQNELEQQKFKKQMADLGDSFDAKNHKLWASIQKTFALYKRAEGERMFVEYSDGTIRAVAQNGQEWMVRKQFLELMQTVFIKHSLKTASDNEIEDAKRLVSREYKKSIADFINRYDYLNEANSPKWMKAQYEDDVSEYTSDIRKSQRLWRKLTAQCNELIEQINANKNDAKALANGMVVMLSKNRIRTLKYDPIGD